MVSVSNNVTTEYTYETPATQSTAKSTSPNSVYEVQQPQAASTDTQETVTTAPKTKKEELENLCKELGTTIGEIFHYPLDNLDDAKIQNLIDAIKLAKERSAKNDNFVELAKKYCVAVSCGYTVQEIKEKPQKLNGENINQRMERFFGLQEGSYANLSEAEKEHYIEKYFNNYFNDLIKQGKDTQSIYRLQMRDFGKLLVNTSDEEKAIFKKAISSLLAENRLPGALAALASFETQEARTEWSAWTVEESAALGKPGPDGKAPEPEIITAIQTALTKEKSQEGLQNFHNDLHTKATALLEKIAKGEELTEEEKLLYNTFKQLYAGEELGTIMNEVVGDEDWKKEFLKQVNNDILTHGEDVFNDVLNQIDKAAEKHPEIVTVPQDKVETALNEATGNKYSEYKEKQNPPAETADIGFVPRKPGNPERVEELRAQYIQPTDRATEFKVDKNVTSPMKDKDEMGTKFKDAKTAQDKLELIKRYYNISPLLRAGLEQFLSMVPDPVGKLNKLPANAREDLARTLVRKGKLNEEEINALNLSYGAKQLLLNDLQMIKKNEEAQK